MNKLANKLNQVVSTGSTFTGKELGTFSDFLSETDEVDFSQKNLDNEIKQVCVFIYENDTDAPKSLCCSKRLSKTVRKALSNGHTRTDVLSALLTLQVIENEQGLFISPEGAKNARIKVKSLMKHSASYNDLVALSNK